MDFPLHTYLKELQVTNSSIDYIAVIRKNTIPLVEKQVPVILTLRQLSYITDIPYKYYVRIIKRTMDPYRVFSIQKRSGGKRYICVPDEYLLMTQQWIHKYILCSEYAIKRLSSNVTAYLPKSSHVDNAKRHLGADWILKLDITNFFEAISERQVYYVFRSLGYRALVAFSLSRICTRIIDKPNDYRLRKKRWSNKKEWKYSNTKIMGHLPQGAPTSPMLANLVCIELDGDLKKIATSEGLVYTRYADDITLSGSEKDLLTTKILLSNISSLIGKYGFSVNRLKTKIIKDGNRKVITGLLVDGDKLRVPKPYKDEIRKELYYISKYGLENHCDKIKKRNHFAYLMRLKGRIQYIIYIEKTTGQKMMDQFYKIFPHFNEIESALK